jgi:peptidoglycan/xylan/chitin deacetylase (PgdA/CDA1 family)
VSGFATSRRLPRGVFYVTALVVGALLAHLRAPTRSEATPGAALARVEATIAPLPTSRLIEERIQAIQIAPPATIARPDPLSLPQRENPAAYGGGRTISGATAHRLIFFSFDDGPDLRTTPRLLDRLDVANVKAAFFLTASRIAGHSGFEREQAELARTIVARGHLIGNHTRDHHQLPLLNDADVLDQVIDAELIFQRVLGFRPRLIRPPGGARSPRTTQLLAALGLTSVLWNLGAGDFKVKSAGEVLDMFRSGLSELERERGQYGGVVLLHDTYRWSVDAFDLIFEELWRRNCRLLERGEELYDIVRDLRFFYQARGDAAPGAVADPAEPPAEVLAERQNLLRIEARLRCSAHRSSTP